MATDCHMKILQRVISTYQPFFILMLCRTEYFPSLSGRCRNALNSIKWESYHCSIGGSIPWETDQLPVDIFSRVKRRSALRRG